jgi:uncharacterized membrane protein
VVFCALSLISVRAAGFQGLDALPGAYASYAWGVSGDGTVIVGQSMAMDGSEAVRWTKQGQASGLGCLPGGKNSLAKGASRDGSIIAGLSTQFDPERGFETGWWAFQWSPGTGMQSLGVGEAYRVNASGTVIVGTGGEHSEASRWVNGVRSPLTGVTSVDCRDVSDDGSMAVGTMNGRAYRWIAGQGPADLGSLPGETFSEAYGISGDGRYVVGVSYGVSPGQAFRWSQAEGMIGLGALPPPPNGTSRANAVSTNGAVVVGLSADAFVWDWTHGMRSVKEVLTRQGFDLTDWTLEEATGVSDDGRTIVGTGTFHDGSQSLPKAWVATVDNLTLPELTITDQGSESLICWPGLEQFNLWQLQSAVQVTGSWTNEIAVPAWAGGQYQVTLPKAAGQKFYRLLSPQPQ